MRKVILGVLGLLTAVAVTAGTAAPNMYHDMSPARADGVTPAMYHDM